MAVADSYKSIADVTLWLKVQSKDPLYLSDVPEIIPLRWTYFRDNWEFIKSELNERKSQYSNPDFLDEQIRDFSSFIESQRNSSIKFNPLSGIFVFYKFYAIFDSIQINSIAPTNEENSIIERSIRRVDVFTKNDFVNARTNITKIRDEIADIVGQPDPDYNFIYHRSSVPQQVDISITYINQMQQLENTINVVNFILANLFVTDDTFVDPFALARQNANNPDIDIAQYNSGNFVRLDYGEDLQALADRYLGSRDKWIDIAIANGLKPPYIDEVGERLNLISNGSNNQINISGVDNFGNLNTDKLSINQVLFLQSDTQKFPEQRIVTNIIKVPVSGDLVLELNGDNDLDRYKINENANIRIFKPNTINSNFFILIPSTEPLPDSRKDETPWFLLGRGEDEKRAKVDIAFDNDGDLKFTSNGDIQLSYGLSNAVQAVKLKLVTELGALRYHPDFGLIAVQGEKNFNVELVRDSIIESVTGQIAMDPRFDRVEQLDVEYVVSASNTNGASAFIIRLQVRLAGSNQVVPISFAVNIA